MVLRKAALFGFAFLAFFGFQACGGGSGGGHDDFVGAARVDVRVSPSRIDTGNRTEVTIDIHDVNYDGIVLKVLVPVGLIYVQDSAVLRVQGDEIGINPAVDVVADEGRYLVFFLGHSLFGRDDERGWGTVRFRLQAVEPVRNGRISVDADVDDSPVSNNEGFDVEDPQFHPMAEASIEVVA